MQCGASEVLALNVEGESLFNDGVAYVLFQIFLPMVRGNELSIGK